MSDPTIREEVEVLKDKVDSLSKEISTLNQNTTELVQAWNAATGFLRFVKWGAGLAAGIATTWAAVTQIKWG